MTFGGLSGSWSDGVTCRLGKELGLDGKELLQFVKEQQDRDREERQKEREAKKLENEEREKERAEREAQRQHEMAEREAQRQHELQIREVELRSATDRLGAMKLIQPNAVEVVARVPELPKFIDGKGDLDSYLQRFERFARSNKWKQDDWPLSLSALLTGKSLDVYCRLSATAATDYDQLKEALLKR